MSTEQDDIKIAGKTENIKPTWQSLMKDVDPGEPTSFLDRESLGCTQRECKPNEIIIEEFTKMLESRISAGATEILIQDIDLEEPTSFLDHVYLGCTQRECNK